jgi:subtilisin-like proprotein convertase family protein
MTSASATASSNTVLDLIASDGATVLEADNDNGSLSGLSSALAGATVASAGSYFLCVRSDTSTTQIRPYHLYLRLRSGAPDAEVEPNDTTPQTLPASGWVAGSTSSLTDVDLYSLDLAAGDTVYLALDEDPARTGTSSNLRLGLAPFNDFILLVNDDGVEAGPDSEALFVTVKDPGTYVVYIDVDAATGAFGAYGLSVNVRPAADEGQDCVSYVSTDPAQAIPDGGLVSSTITVPDDVRIADVDVAIQATHTLMADLDVTLQSPAGNDNGLFTDVGASVPDQAGLTDLALVLDDEAALPVGPFTVLVGQTLQPESVYRLSWLDEEMSGGTWTLVVRDDTVNTRTGTLDGWSVRICARPPATVTCPAGSSPATVLATDFESGDAGFTHSGTQDEWQRGLPSFVPITSCASGVNCWKTDLTGTYNASSSQNLLSPAIDLTGYLAPVLVTWQQRFNIESASFDHYFVDARLPAGGNELRLFEWYDATMYHNVGATPSVRIQESSGWSRLERRADAFAGDALELVFHLDSDNLEQLTGAAVDDVQVTACLPGAPLIFADGFETGDTSRWSAAVP